MISSTRILALLVLAALFLVPATGSALAADCNVDLRDGGDYLFDVEVELFDLNPPARFDRYGVLSDGGGPNTDDAWDEWGSLFVARPNTNLTELAVGDMYVGPNDCQLAQDGREVRFPVVLVNGLQVQRTIFVESGPLHGARLLTTLRNPGGSPVPATLVQGDPIAETGNLGSDGGTFPAATSDGTGVATPASFWGVTTDEDTLPGRMSSDPALAHVWDGPGGAQRISKVQMEDRVDEVFWTWDVTVPAGGTAAFISYEIQEDEASRSAIAQAAAALLQAESRQIQSLATLYQGLSPVEIAATMNWRRPPAPSAAIKPIANATSATPVVLDGGASTAAAVPALPQCAGIATYAWRTDDGATGSGPTLSHTFAPGPHKATLTVTSCGGSASAETAFVVAKGSAAKNLKLLKVKLNRSNGTATVKVKALVAGKLTLSGKGVKKVSKKLAKPGTATLLVKPTGKVRKRLFARGDAKAKIVVSLKPKRGAATTLRKTLPLKLGD